MYAKTLTAAALVVGFGAAEVRANCPEIDLVRGWYHRYLKREVDPLFGNWVNMLKGGAPPTWAEAGILGSDEYFAIHGSCPEGFVAGLFADVLGRRACAEEVAAWAGRVNGCSRERLAYEFLCMARGGAAVPSGRPIFEPPATISGPVGYGNFGSPAYGAAGFGNRPIGPAGYGNPAVGYRAPVNVNIRTAAYRGR